MIRLELKVDLRYEVDGNGADFVFNIHAAHTASQTISNERLVLSQAIAHRVHTDPVTRNRYMRLRAEPGELKLSYAATVDLTHHLAEPSQLAEVPVRNLPPQVIGYIYPSRYCQSDRLVKMAISEFGHLWQGHSRVQAIRDWVNQRVTFRSNTSNSNTSAVDTLVEQVGICRDFAHLMIALCRAVNIPARFVTGTDYGADPALGPPDFHAYVEAYLRSVGHRHPHGARSLRHRARRRGRRLRDDLRRRQVAGSAHQRHRGRGRGARHGASASLPRGPLDRQRRDGDGGAVKKDQRAFGGAMWCRVAGPGTGS